MDESIYGWMEWSNDLWIDGWMDWWIDGLTNGFIDQSMYWSMVWWFGGSMDQLIGGPVKVREN